MYNIEPFRGAVRQGDWKLIWRSLIPSSVDLYNLAEDPYEKNNVAAAHPDKVAAMQERLNALGKEAAKSLALVWIGGTALKHGKPLMGSENGKGPVLVDDGRMGAPPADVEVVRVRSDRSVHRIKGRCVWVGGRDWRLNLWRPGKATQPIDVQMLDSEITATRWSPDGKRVAVGEKKGQVTVFELVSR